METLGTPGAPAHQEPPDKVLHQEQADSLLRAGKSKWNSPN